MWRNSCTTIRNGTIAISGAVSGVPDMWAAAQCDSAAADLATIATCGQALARGRPDGRPPLRVPMMFRGRPIRAAVAVCGAQPHGPGGLTRKAHPHDTPPLRLPADRPPAARQLPRGDPPDG